MEWQPEDLEMVLADSDGPTPVLCLPLDATMDVGK